MIRRSLYLKKTLTMFCFPILKSKSAVGFYEGQDFIPFLEERRMVEYGFVEGQYLKFAYKKMGSLRMLDLVVIVKNDENHLVYCVNGVDITSVHKSTVVNNGAERILDDHHIKLDMAKEIAIDSTLVDITRSRIFRSWNKLRYVD